MRFYNLLKKYKKIILSILLTIIFSIPAILSATLKAGIKSIYMKFYNLSKEKKKLMLSTLLTILFSVPAEYFIVVGDDSIYLLLFSILTLAFLSATLNKFIRLFITSLLENSWITAARLIGIYILCGLSFMYLVF